jgi:hypothetical protein
MNATKPFTIPKRLVYEAFLAVKANAGAAGVDKETIDDFATNLKDNLYRIWNRMSSGSYFPPPVKAVAIPKKNGGERILGIPTVADRVMAEPCFAWTHRWWSNGSLSPTWNRSSYPTPMAIGPASPRSMPWR